MKDELVMDSRDAVRKMASESEMSLTKIAEVMGFASVSGLTNKFGARDMRIGFMQEIAEICGYEVVLRSKDGTKRDILIVGNQE